MSVGELACTYAALALASDGIGVTAEKISTLVQAANVNVESYWPPLFAKLLENKSVADLIGNVGSSVAAVPVAAAGVVTAGAAPVPAVEAQKEEADEDDFEDYRLDLFD